MRIGQEPEQSVVIRLNLDRPGEESLRLGCTARPGVQVGHAPALIGGLVRLALFLVNVDQSFAQLEALGTEHDQLPEDRNVLGQFSGLCVLLDHAFVGLDGLGQFVLVFGRELRELGLQVMIVRLVLKSLLNDLQSAFLILFGKEVLNDFGEERVGAFLIAAFSQSLGPFPTQIVPIGGDLDHHLQNARVVRTFRARSPVGNEECFQVRKRCLRSTLIDEEVGEAGAPCQVFRVALHRLAERLDRIRSHSGLDRFLHPSLEGIARLIGAFDLELELCGASQDFQIVGSELQSMMQDFKGVGRLGILGEMTLRGGLPHLDGLADISLSRQRIGHQSARLIALGIESKRLASRGDGLFGVGISLLSGGHLDPAFGGFLVAAGLLKQ